MKPRVSTHVGTPTKLLTRSYRGHDTQSRCEGPTFWTAVVANGNIQGTDAEFRLPEAGTARDDLRDSGGMPLDMTSQNPGKIVVLAIPRCGMAVGFGIPRRETPAG